MSRDARLRAVQDIAALHGTAPDVRSAVEDALRCGSDKAIIRALVIAREQSQPFTWSRDYANQALGLPRFD